MTKQEFIDYIKSLTVLELADLVHAVEEEFGVSAAATAVAVTGPDGELTFTLYPRLSITLADRLHAVLTSYQFTFAFFLLILPLTLLALPALLIFLLQRRSRRQP